VGRQLVIDLCPLFTLHAAPLLQRLGVRDFERGEFDAADEHLAGAIDLLWREMSLWEMGTALTQVADCQAYQLAVRCGIALKRRSQRTYGLPSEIILWSNTLLQWTAKKRAAAEKPVSGSKMKAIIISLCFFAVGVGILSSGVSNLMMANKAKLWPTTDGTIKSSKCVYYYVMSEGSTYLTHVNYSYTVAGRSYEGDRIAFGYRGSWWHGPNQKIADRLSSARTVLVRYDPNRPSMAVLSCGLNASTVMTLFGGSWLLLISAAIGSRLRRPHSNSGMLALSFGPNLFRIIIQGFGGIMLLAVTGLAIVWIGGLLSDCGILNTLVTN
jgi:hypothetical protein